MRRWLLPILILPILLTGLTACQERLTTEEILENVRTTEATIDDAHAIIEISLHTDDEQTDIAFEVWEKRPNLSRVVILEAQDESLHGLTYIMDGQQFWIHDPATEEVIVGQAGTQEPSTPIDILNLLDEALQEVLTLDSLTFTCERNLSGIPTYEIASLPQPGQSISLPVGSQATLWIDQEQWIIRQAHFFGEGWMQVRSFGFMRLRSFEFNTGLSQSDFDFAIPPNARLVQAEDIIADSTLTLREAQNLLGLDLLMPTHVPENSTLRDVFNISIENDPTPTIILYYEHPTRPFIIAQSQSAIPALMRETPYMGELVPGYLTPTYVSSTSVGDYSAELLQVYNTEMELAYYELSWRQDQRHITISGFIDRTEIQNVAESLE